MAATCGNGYVFDKLLKKKTRYIQSSTDKQWLTFVARERMSVRHPARKRSGSILRTHPIGYSRKPSFIFSALLFVAGIGLMVVFSGMSLLMLSAVLLIYRPSSA